MDPTAKTGLMAFGIALALLGVIGGIILAVAYPSAAFMALLVVGLIFLSGGVVTVLTFLILRNASFGTECPKCGKWWARVLVDRETVNQVRCHGLVARTAHTSSSSFIPGNYSGGFYQTGRTIHGSSVTRWKERAPVVRTTYRATYSCKRCQHQWEQDEVEQVEDFGN